MNNLVYNCHNVVGGINLYYVDSTTKSTIKFNDFFTDTGMAVTYGHNGSHVNDTVSQFQGTSFDSGTTVANNQEVNPQLTSGTLPSGLDANFLPNSDFFKLTANSPSAVRSTGNSSLTGDAAHGYSSASSKFSTDILGVSRVNWSMGAYEYGGSVSLPPIGATNLRIVQTP